jgi:hypothetical protein
VHDGVIWFIVAPQLEASKITCEQPQSRKRLKPLCGLRGDEKLVWGNVACVILLVSWRLASPYLVGFHSRQRRCASAICAGVMLAAIRSLSFFAGSYCTAERLYQK